MLSENIKNCRKALGLSQEELAERLHVVRQTVSKWEKGLSVPDAEMLVRIAQELGSTVNALLGETICNDDRAVDIKEVADGLARLNDQMAEENRKRNRRGQIACIMVGLISFLGLLQGIVTWAYSYFAGRRLGADNAIIGGADAPTAIYVSSLSVNGWAMLFAAAGLVAALFGLCRLRRR